MVGGVLWLVWVCIRGMLGQPTEAMETLHRFISESFEDLSIDIRDEWLDPRLGLVHNVALLRSLVEDLAPCRAVIVIAGGLRWLSAALMFLSLTLATAGGFTNIKIEPVQTMLEEESPSIRALFKGTERIITWPFVPRLVDLTLNEYIVLKQIASGRRRAKELHGELNKDCRRPRGCVSMATIQRILTKLVRKGLVTHEHRGKGFLYNLTPLGMMLVERPKA